MAHVSGDIALDVERHGLSSDLRGAHHTRTDSHVYDHQNKLAIPCIKKPVVTVGRMKTSDSEASYERTLEGSSSCNTLCDRSYESYSVNELKPDKVFDDQHHLVANYLNPSKLSECKAEVGTKPKPNTKVYKGKIEQQQTVKIKGVEMKVKIDPVDEIFSRLEHEKISVVENENILTYPVIEPVNQDSKIGNRNWFKKLQEQKIGSRSKEKIKNSAGKKIKKKKIILDTKKENYRMESMNENKESELKRLFEKMREKENLSTITDKKIITPKKITPLRKRLDRGPDKQSRSVRDMILKYEGNKM